MPRSSSHSPAFRSANSLERSISHVRGRDSGLTIDPVHAPRPRRHDDDPVAQEQRLVDAVGDEHRRLALALPDLEQLLLQDPAGLLVEGTERFVEQQDPRIDRKRTRQADALLHAAGQLLRQPLLEALETNHLDELARCLQPLLAVGAAQLQPEGDVRLDVEPRQQGEALEHDGAVRARAVDGLAVDA